MASRKSRSDSFGQIFSPGSLVLPEGESSSLSNLKIPIYRELLAYTCGYEETVILNQLLYFCGERNRDGLSLYDIFYLTSFDKTLQTLRKRLLSLEKKHLIIKSKNTLYGKTYYRPIPELYIENTDLIALLEGGDFKYGDYYSCAIINYFRQQLLKGSDRVSISHTQLKEILRMDKSRVSVGSRLGSLLRSGVIKGTLRGRIYHYELHNSLLNDKAPEVIDSLAGKLTEYFSCHLERFGFSIPKRAHLSFQRMLVDGFDYDLIKNIIAGMGYKQSPLLWKITQVSHIRKSYRLLIDDVGHSLSKRKTNRYLYKLVNGFLSPSQKVIEPQVKTVEAPVSSPKIPDDSIIWDIVTDWLQKNESLIKKLYYKHISNINSILEYDDIYNSLLPVLFKNIKKNGELCLCSDYLDKYIFGFLRGSYTQSYGGSDESFPEVPTCESISSEHSNVDISNIIDKFHNIPNDVLHLSIDSLSLNGVRYSQRELAVKYKLSLSKVNRQLKKWLPIFQKQLSEISLHPPSG